MEDIMNGLSVIFTPLIFYYAGLALHSRFPYAVFSRFKKEKKHVDAALWDLIGVIFLLAAALCAILYWRLFWISRFVGYEEAANWFQSFGVTVNFFIRYIFPLIGAACLLRASELYWQRKIQRIWPVVLCLIIGVVMLVVLLQLKAQPH